LLLILAANIFFHVFFWVPFQGEGKVAPNQSGAFRTFSQVFHLVCILAEAKLLPILKGDPDYFTVLVLVELFSYLHANVRNVPQFIPCLNTHQGDQIGQLFTQGSFVKLQNQRQFFPWCK
jgi:hypothetical protein